MIRAFKLKSGFSVPDPTAVREYQVLEKSIRRKGVKGTYSSQERPPPPYL